MEAGGPAGRAAVVRFEAELDGQTLPVEVTGSGGRYRVSIGDEAFEVDARRPTPGVWSLLIAGVSSVAEVADEGGAYAVTVGEERYRIAVEEETRYLIRTRGGAARARGQLVKAPMPGRVVLVEVTAGQAVQPGDGLVVLEAMKMENELKAAVPGTVRDVRVTVGQTVNPGDVLVVIE
jgi:biotin carboxyl carrier protein